MKISEIFLNEPIQWGFRGDPFLWREMRDRLKEVDMPDSPDALRGILKQTYKESTGFELEGSKTIIIERFKSHGMSSGGISPKFWQEHGVPMLVERHVKP